MSEIRTIPPQLTRDQWNALLDHALEKPASYIIRKNGSYYEAINGTTGKIDYSGTDAASVIQSAINALTRAGMIYLKSGVYIITQPITLKCNTLLVGEVGIDRDTSTCLKVDASFPANNYVLKIISDCNRAFTGGIENIFLYNPNYATTMAYGVLLDASTANTILNNYHIRNLRTNYIDKAIHLKGYVWNCVVENIILADIASAYVGSQDIILERAGGSDRPKINNFNNIKIIHAGTVTNAIYVDGHYNKFVNVDVDGGHYDESVIKFDGNGTASAQSNFVLNYRGQDLLTTANTKANVYFSGSNCLGNWVEGLISTLSKNVKFDNGAYRNYVKMSAFGSNPVIDATDAGIDNMVEFITPHLTSGTTFTLAHSGASVIYKGYRMANSGTAVGTGAQQSIAHGCSFTPTKAQVTVSNIDDGANPYLSANPDATNIYVTAVNGKTFRWEVKYNP